MTLLVPYLFFVLLFTGKLYFEAPGKFACDHGAMRPYQVVCVKYDAEIDGGVICHPDFSFFRTRATDTTRAKNYVRQTAAWESITRKRAIVVSGLLDEKEVSILQAFAHTFYPNERYELNSCFLLTG